MFTQGSNRYRSEKKDAWFVLYHKYSLKETLDKEGLSAFRKDCEILSKTGVRYVIIEDYFKKARMGTYLDVYSKETLSGMIKIIKENGMEFYPYFILTDLDENICKKHLDWVVTKNGQQRKGYNLIHNMSLGNKKYYWGEIPGMQALKVCPASGFYQYLMEQIHVFLQEYSCAGIYLDCAYWDFMCDNHTLIQNMNAMAMMVKGIRELVKKHTTKGIVIINDYFICRPCMNAVNELEGVNIDATRDSYTKLGEEILGKSADIILLEYDPEIGRKESNRIVESLQSKYQKPIIIFRHWDGAKGIGNLNLSLKAAASFGGGIVYFFPFRLAPYLEDTQLMIDYLLCKK